MPSARRFTECATLAFALSGCALFDGSPDPGVVVVRVTGLPDGAVAPWELTLTDGRPVAKGEVTTASADTANFAGADRHYLRFSPLYATVDGIRYGWAVPTPIVLISPAGDGGTIERVGDYAQTFGALGLRAVTEWAVQVRATITPVPPTPGGARGTGFFASTDERIVPALPFGPYEIAWPSLSREMGFQGRFQSTWSHTYRAKVDTVTVAPVPHPAVDTAVYTLRSGAFRVSYTGLPAGQLVGFGFTRTDGGVAFGATLSTTPGLEAVIPTEFLGSYRYSSADVVVSGVTYRAATSPLYTISAALTPVEVVIHYAPVP